MGEEHEEVSSARSGLSEWGGRLVSRVKDRALDVSYQDVTRLSRRELLAGIGAVATYRSLNADTWPHIDQFDTNLYFLQNMDIEDAKAYIGNTADIMNGATTTDWAYRDDRTFTILDEVTTAVERMFLGAMRGGAPIDDIEQMATFQSACPDEYLVSSPYDDVRATFTADGRLSTLHTGEHHQSVYLPAPKGADVDPPLPGEGGAAGLVLDDEVAWVWGDAFEQIDHDGTRAAASFTYEHRDTGVRVKQDVSMPFDASRETGSGTVRLDYTVENGGSEPVDIGFVYALRANANRNLQDPIFFRTSGNIGTAGDELRWQDVEDGQELRLRMDDADDAGFIRHRISDGDRDRVYRQAEAYLDDRVIIDDIPPLHRRLRNHLMDAIEQDPYTLEEGAAFEELLEAGEESVFGRYLTGYQRADVTVPAGGSESFTVTITPGADADTHAAEDTGTVDDAWDAWLDEAVDLNRLHPDFRAEAKDWVAVLAKTWMPGRGTGHAAPHYQPSYSRVWIRDVSSVADAFMALGRTEEAWDFYTEYVPSIQEDDGGLHQAYTSTGAPAYLVEETTDQVADWLIGLDQLNDMTSRDAFRAAGVGNVRAAADFLQDSLVANNLPEAGWDYAESPHEYRISLYTADKTQRALEAVQPYVEEDLTPVLGEMQRSKESHFLSDDPFTEAISLNTLDTDYSGMAGVIYLTGHEDDPRYLEEMFEDIGVENVSGWTVGSNLAARAAATLGDTELTVNGQTYTGRELAYRRLKANVERAQDHGVLYEKIDEDGEPYGARHLAWSHAEAIQAAAAIDNDFTPR